MKRPEIDDIARAGFAAYIVAFALSFLLLATPGGYLPAYVIMCACASFGAASAKRSLRLWVIPLVLLASGMALLDWGRGLDFHQQQLRERERMVSGVTGPTSLSSEKE